MKLNIRWTGPWEVIKHLGEVVYRIKYCGTAAKVALQARQNVLRFLVPLHRRGLMVWV